MIGRTPAPDEASRFFLLRLIDAVSLLAIPFLILFFPFYAALRRIPVYEEFVEGGKEGFQVIIRILPFIVGMLAAVSMFTAAGGMDLITRLFSPLTKSHRVSRATGPAGDHPALQRRGPRCRS